MHSFIFATAIYFAFATALNFALRGDITFVGQGVLGTTQIAIGIVQSCAILFGLLAALSWRTSPNASAWVSRLAHALIAIMVCTVFLASYSSVKTALPMTAELFGVNAFFADPALAELDRVIHFGFDPWVWAHDISQIVAIDQFAAIAAQVYFFWWLVPAFFFPVILVILGEDEDTKRHYLFLYLFVWIGLGNLAALLGLSAGPVFYDDLFGTERFAELNAALAVDGFRSSVFATMQAALLDAYVQNGQAAGSGISAFPSVHVATMCVFMLYTMQKGRLFACLGVFMLVAIFFISVWTGYHYALDGYASFALVLAAHAWLKRRQKKGGSDQAIDAPILVR